MPRLDCEPSVTSSVHLLYEAGRKWLLSRTVYKRSLRTLFLCSIIILSTVLAFQLFAQHGLSVSSPSTNATSGSSFDHVVVIAMENQNFGSVIGSSAAPFTNSLAAVGSTMSSYHSYGAGAFSGDSISGCSA